MRSIQLPIQTASLRIRWLNVEEAERMMELNAEPTTRRWLPSHVYADLTEATSRMQYLVGCYSLPGDPRLGPYVLGIEHMATGALLGHVGFSPFDNDVEVSYAIGEDQRGHRYGTEALKSACNWAAATFNLNTLLALTEVENIPSRRTLEHTGFVHDKDIAMKFQGNEETVARYLWHRSQHPRVEA